MLGDYIPFSVPILYFPIISIQQRQMLRNNHNLGKKETDPVSALPQEITLL